MLKLASACSIPLDFQLILSLIHSTIGMSNLCAWLDLDAILHPFSDGHFMPADFSRCLFTYAHILHDQVCM